MNTMTLNQLQALVASPEWRAADRTEALVRSIQQTLKVEGIVVTAVHTALKSCRSTDGF